MTFAALALTSVSSFQGDDYHDETSTTDDRSAVPGVVRVWRDPDDLAARAGARRLAASTGADVADSGEPDDVLGQPDGAALAEVHASEPTGEPAATGSPPPEPAADDVLPDACQRGPIEAQICAVFGDAGPAAIAIAACESGHDALGRLDGIWATSGDSFGLFQIHYIHAARFPGFWERWHEPEFNIMMAYTLYVEHGGWGPWACRWAAY